MRLLHHAFEAAAARLPAKTALVAGARRVTYAELAQRVAALAALLQADGVEPGDRVVLLLESDIEYAVALHAVLVIGAVVVPLGVTTKADKLAFVIDDTEARVLLADERLAAAWQGVEARCPSLRLTCASWRRQSSARPARRLSSRPSLRLAK